MNGCWYSSWKKEGIVMPAHLVVLLIVAMAMPIYGLSEQNVEAPAKSSAPMLKSLGAPVCPYAITERSSQLPMAAHATWRPNPPLVAIQWTLGANARGTTSVSYGGQALLAACMGMPRTFHLLV